jgi:hypothetical protein
MAAMSTTIPTPDKLRADIRARVAELRALRRLLRLAEAAQVLGQARIRPTVEGSTKTKRRPGRMGEQMRVSR